MVQDVAKAVDSGLASIIMQYPADFSFERIIGQFFVSVLHIYKCNTYFKMRPKGHRVTILSVAYKGTYIIIIIVLDVCQVYCE